jgi:hypothetical protein
LRSFYIKAKQYKVKEDKISDALKYVGENHTGYKADTAIKYILGGKLLTFKRWLYYFDYDFLSNILISEDLLNKEKEEGEQVN